MPFKIEPRDAAKPKQRAYANGHGLRVVFWRDYADIYHAPSGSKVCATIHRKPLGVLSLDLSVKDVLAMAERLAALTDWTRAAEDVFAACMADDRRIYRQIQAIVPARKAFGSP